MASAVVEPGRHGIGVPDATMHVLQARAVRERVPLQRAPDLKEHKTLKVLMQIYAHPQADDVGERRRVKALARPGQSWQSTGAGREGPRRTAYAGRCKSHRGRDFSWWAALDSNQ